MKTPVTTTGLLLVLLTTACESPQQSGDNTLNSLQGTWELVSQRLTTPDSTMHLSAPTPPARKVLNATHFATGRQIGDSIAAGGGRYDYDGGTYTEIIQYHSDTSIVGDTISYDARLEGDTTWIFSGMVADSVELEETWRRIE